MRAYGAGGVPGADDGLGAEDVRDEVAADPRVLHLERHVELRPAVPRLRGGAALARLPAAAPPPAASAPRPSMLLDPDVPMATSTSGAAALAQAPGVRVWNWGWWCWWRRRF